MIRWDGTRATDRAGAVSRKPVRRELPHLHRFDHDRARRLKAAGFSLRNLARAFGVSPTAVFKAVHRCH